MLSFFNPYYGIRIRLSLINIIKSQKICWNDLARDNLPQYLFNVHCAKVSFTNTIFGRPRWVRFVKAVWNWSVIKMKHPVLCAQCTANNWLPKNPIRSSVCRLFFMHPFLSLHISLLLLIMWMTVIEMGKQNDKCNMKSLSNNNFEEKWGQYAGFCHIFSYRMKKCPNILRWEAEISFW